MDWDDLRYFLAIHRAGTLAGAGRALDVEHTTVSRRLAALERDLGATLFLRGPDGFTLTVAGTSLLPQAEAMESAADAARRALDGDDGRARGTVRLTTSEAFSGFLVKRLAPLRARHPELLVEILASNRPLDLARGEADLALRMTKATEPELVTRRLAETGWSLYAAGPYVERRGIPASHEDLSGHDVVAFDASLAKMPGAVWLGAGRGGTPSMRANSILAALNAAVAGFGVAPLPCVLGDAEPALVRLTPELVVTCTAYLVVHKDLGRTARVRAAMDFLVDLITAEAKALLGRP